MKKVFALLMLAAFTLGACEKDNSVKPQNEEEQSFDQGDRHTLSTYD